MVRHAKSSVAESGSLDYADVAHATVTTPVAGGKTHGGVEKRKQQAMAKDATRHASSKGGKENTQVQFRNLPEDIKDGSNKRAKRDTEGGGGAASSSTPSSVRYPRLNYGEIIPLTDRMLTSEDVTDEEKMLYLARRVMEADTLEVENILMSTKYNHLSAEMSKYAGIVEKRLGNALATDTALEQKEVAELTRLQARKAKDEKACASLDEEAAGLRMELAKWQAMEKQVEAEGRQLPATLEKARKKEAARQDDTPYESPDMKETKVLLASGPEVRTAVLATATSLIDALENKLPGLADLEMSAQEKQKELVEAFQGAQFAGFPNVHAPQKAARVLATGSTEEKKKA